MAALRKPLLLCITLALIFTKIASEPPPASDEAFASELPHSSLQIELDQLKSRISFLELSVNGRTNELRSKDESIRQMEIVIQEKSDSIALLQNEMESLQQSGSLDANEQVGKPHARAGDLEKQVDKLRKEIEMQNKKKDALEARAVIAEKKIEELNSKLENLQKVNNEQKTRICKTERALQVTQEALMTAKVEAGSISKELTEVRGEWLPQRLAVHLAYFQSYLVTHWNERVRPTLDVTIQKALEKKAQVEKWAKPHIRTFNTKWTPMMKEQWLTFITYVEPCVQSLTIEAVEVYHALMNSVTPHIVKAHQMTDPYIQEARKFTEPYIDYVKMMTKPHFNKVCHALKPYTKKMVRAYKKLIKSTTVYHHQVQEMLKNNDMTRSLATMELAWFVATALLTLPVVFMFKLFSAIFRKRPTRHTRSSHINHTRRKRRHPEN